MDGWHISQQSRLFHVRNWSESVYFPSWQRELHGSNRFSKPQQPCDWYLQHPGESDGCKHGWNDPNRNKSVEPGRRHETIQKCWHSLCSSGSTRASHVCRKFAASGAEHGCWFRSESNIASRWACANHGWSGGRRESSPRSFHPESCDRSFCSSHCNFEHRSFLAHGDRATRRDCPNLGGNW